MTQASPALMIFESREVLTGGNVRGGIVRAHLRWVRDYHGEEAVTLLLSKLGVTVRHEIETALASSWCRFDVLIALDRAIAERFGRGRDLMRELGRYSAHLNLSTTYRNFKRQDVAEFLGRSALLHAQFQDFGRVEFQQLSLTSCETRHLGARCFSPVYCASSIGYYEQVAVMHGGESVVVEELQCLCEGDEACVFRLRWS